MDDEMQGTYADSDLPPCEWLEQWAEENPDLVAGTTPMVEIVDADTPGDPVAAELLWGADLPEELRPGSGSPVPMAAQAGYLACQPSLSEDWRDDLGGCRAVILPDQAPATPADVQALRRFVRQGGVAIAFGHATMLEGETLREDYALADVFGAHCGGLVRFETDALQVEVTGDSIWAPQYSPPNVIDGDPATFWASIEAGPMPHWVEIALSKPVTIGGAKVACRPGFLLKDFDVQCKVGDEWKTCAEVTDNNEWAIDLPFAEPVETSAARLFLKREEINGENRVIADVGEFTLLDENGRPLIAPPYVIEGRFTAPELQEALRSDRLIMRSPAVRIEPATAEVLATFVAPLEGVELPLCTRNRFGKGTAYLLAIPASGLGQDPPVWEGLLRAFVGMPAIRHSGDESVLAFLRKGKRRSVLQLYDMNPGGEGRAKEVIVRANTGILGRITTVQVAPDGPELETKLSGEYVQFVAPLDPRVNIVMRHGR